MKPLLLLALLRRSLLLLAGAALTTHLVAATANVSESNDAKNLARMNCGAQIIAVDAEGRITGALKSGDSGDGVTALIMDDDTLSYPLQEGRNTFVIKLPTTATLDRFTFVNENAAAAGELKIAVSNYQLAAASEKWIPVDGRVAFSHKRLFNLSLLGVEARYVKLEFNVQKGGRIAALGLYGEQGLESFSRRNVHVIRDGIGGRQTADAMMMVTNKTSRDTIEDSLNFNFANSYARATVVYVSSGITGAARRMIDDDTMTAFPFAASDRHPLAIVELAASEQLHRVSALYTMRSGRLDVFLLNELQDDPADLSKGKLIASITDTKRSGKAALDFDPQGARYVALRWTPEGDGDNEPFEVAEINAFGTVPLAMLNFAALPQAFAANLTTSNVPTLPEVPTLPVIPVVSP